MLRWVCVALETMAETSLISTFIRHSVSPMEEVDPEWDPLECKLVHSQFPGVECNNYCCIMHNIILATM